MKNPSTLVGGVRFISLTQGKQTCIDEADWAEVQKYRWYATKGGNTFYAGTNLPRDPATGKKTSLSLHALLIPDAFSIDHKDGNGLRNLRENLRPATKAEQAHNRKKMSGCSSDFKGVSWLDRLCKWRARICYLGKDHFLGGFLDELAAARAYDAAAIKLFGPFARLNFPTGGRR